MKEIINFGYANGWAETPELVKKCDHRGPGGMYVKNVGRCLTEYGCFICGYKYTVDSSD